MTLRLFLDHPLGAGQAVVLSSEQAHYLGNVMRRRVGEVIEVFNGRDGGWEAEITSLSRRSVEARLIRLIREQRDPPDLWLCFAPIKKARTDFIVEKAAELGARRIIPVQTDHTNTERIRQPRLQAHAVEAAEQCGGTFVPEVSSLTPLSVLLEGLGNRRLFWCDEAAAGPATALAGQPRGAWAILIGPEGGFSEAERASLMGFPGAVRASLGPRILRADTAAVAALTLWQAELGDWNS